MAEKKLGSTQYGLRTAGIACARSSFESFPPPRPAFFLWGWDLIAAIAGWALVSSLSERIRLE